MPIMSTENTDFGAEKKSVLLLGTQQQQQQQRPFNGL